MTDIVVNSRDVFCFLYMNLSIYVYAKLKNVVSPRYPDYNFACSNDL